MATTKRSTRRAESLQRPQENQHLSKQAQIIATHPTRTISNVLQQSNTSVRMKRPLDLRDSNLDPPKANAHKRARITVEIVARPLPQAISPPRTVTVKPQATFKSTVVTTLQKLPPPPQPPPAQPAEAAPKTATVPQPALTQHQKKVNNGIKHELDRLQPNAADVSIATVKDQGRKLRSQEATRFKSELLAYFPDYDEVIGNVPKEHHILNTDTPIIVVDSKPRHPHNARPLPSSQHDSAIALQSSTSVDPRLTQHHGNPPQDPPLSTPADDEYPVRVYGDALFTDLFDAQRIDFAFLGARHNDDTGDDPLPDSHYAPAHKKAERLEKSIRNTEKGRAQHERDQIIRLLNELQGPDWLRTMGVSGITESRKKTFEPARDHFIRGCQAILEKFRIWSEEERKRKREKELARAEEALSDEDEEEADEEDEEAEEDEILEEYDEVPDEDEEMADVQSQGGVSDGDPPDYSDVDASIAKQLHEEVVARENLAPSISSKRSFGDPPPMSPEPYIPPEEFTSFFRKMHQRDAALNRHRRSGRSVMAWGDHVPETSENVFALPEEYLDEDTLKARERSKRRDRRGSRPKR